MNASAASTEMTVLGWSVVLLIAQIVAQMLSYARDVGLDYAMSPRDSEDERISQLTSRLTRALKNLLETYPAFIALVLALAFTGKTGGWAANGALIWFWARVAYVPVFTAGIPMLRTAVWSVSMVGLLIMLTSLMG